MDLRRGDANVQVKADVLSGRSWVLKPLGRGSVLVGSNPTPSAQALRNRRSKASKGEARVSVACPALSSYGQLITAISAECVPALRGVWGDPARPRTRPERVIADKGYPSRANRAWLREHGIAATIPERDDQITHRRKKPGWPIDFGDDQKVRYRGRNIVGRCVNKLKQWRGIAMRSDKTARNYYAGLCLAATPPLAHHRR
jgi:transposase